MDRQRFISRKTFLQLAILGVASGFILLWKRLTTVHALTTEDPKSLTLNPDKFVHGTHFNEKFILVKTENSLKIFSNACTHAGCRINTEIDGELICPCHGSRFDAFTGRALKGPAGLPLKSIPFKRDNNSGNITLKV